MASKSRYPGLEMKRMEGESDIDWKERGETALSGRGFLLPLREFYERGFTSSRVAIHGG